MLDHETRSAILRLAKNGHGSRFIARAMGVARKSVQQVVKSGEPAVPSPQRPDQLSPYLDEIRALHHACQGNRVRVHEELSARHGLEVPYSTLTRFCRAAGIGVPPRAVALL